MLLGTGYNFLAPFAAAIAAVTALIVFIRALLNKKFEPLFVISYAYMILELFVYFLFWGADVLPSDRIIDGVNLKSLWSGEVENPDFYLDEKSYALFLLSAFALYQKDMANGDYTSIRQFDNFVRLAHFERAEQCGMNGYCTHQFVIESDGSVYPCDFYCTDEYLLGNISDKDFFTLEHSNKAVEFIKESLVVDETCKSCEYYMLCKGGCKRERRDVEKCKAYKTFFRFALPYLKNMS